MITCWSGQVRPRQGTEICNFGAPSPLEDFLLLSSIYVQFGKMSPRKSGESSGKSSGESRVKSCHVCRCHGFFSPELGFIICEIFTVITLQDWVSWGIFTVIPGYPQRTNGDSQHLEERPELQDWLRSELSTV